MLLNDDFLLASAWARRLYHGYAEDMPIIDYHCHLVSREIYQNKGYEYFRRVLCQVVGEWVDQGRLPEDEEYLGSIIRDICYNNARDQLGLLRE